MSVDLDNPFDARAMQVRVEFAWLRERIDRLQLMLEAALEAQEAALASQESILSYSTIPGRHREVIRQSRNAIRLTREAARRLREPMAGRAAWTSADE